MARWATPAVAASAPGGGVRAATTAVAGVQSSGCGSRSRCETVDAPIVGGWRSCREDDSAVKGARERAWACDRLKTPTTATLASTVATISPRARTLVGFRLGSFDRDRKQCG